MLEMTTKKVSRWCESGKIPAVPKPYGKRTTYLISPQVIEFLKQEPKQKVQKPQLTQKKHKDFVPAWKAALSNGTMTGRAFSSRTVRLYQDYSEEFFTRYSQLSAETLEAALNRIPANSISKRQNFYKAMISLGKYLIRQHALAAEFIDKAKVLSPKRHLPPKRHTLSPEQLATILQSCTKLQDKLIIQLLASTGIRNAEACSLKVSDIHLEAGVLVVRCGKGGKERKVGLPHATIQILQNYLQKTKRVHEAFLLLDVNGKQLTIDGLFQRVQRIGRQAGEKVSPHVLRRTFVTHNANKSRPLQMLQIACGHTDIKTTMSYCRTTEDEVIAAMKEWD